MEIGVETDVETNVEIGIETGVESVFFFFLCGCYGQCLGWL